MSQANSARDPSHVIDLGRELPFQLGDVNVRPASREISRGSDRDVLEPRVMQVLVALVRAGGEIVTRDQLIASCWEGRIVGEDAIIRAISRLRRVSEGIGRGAFTLETITKVGYRLVPGHEDGARMAAAAEPAKDGRPASKLRSGAQQFPFAGLAILAGLVLSILWWAGRPSAPAPASVAVTPLEAQQDAADLAASMDDQLVLVMAANKLNPIIQEDSADTLGEGDPDFVLSGTVRRTESGVAASVRLVQSSSGLALWSSAYQRPIAQATYFEREVALGAADALRCAQRTTRDLEGPALAHYLRGCTLLRDSWEHGEEVRSLALDLTDRAPRFSRGWSLLANASASTALADESRAAFLRQEGRRAAARAIRLDRRNSEGYIALSFLAARDDWDTRRRYADLALQAEPDSSDAIGTKAVLDYETGRFADALRALERVAILDPLTQRVSQQIPLLRAFARHDEADALAARVRQEWPGSSEVQAILLFDALFDDPDPESPADGQWRSRSYRFDPAVIAALEAGRRARLGSAQERASAARVLRAQAIGGLLPAGAALPALSQLGDLDGAFAVAEIHSSGTAPLSHRLFSASTHAMRRDRRFIALADRFGLVRYWTKNNEWPDFCSDVSLPYDCRAEAARLQR